MTIEDEESISPRRATVIWAWSQIIFVIVNLAIVFANILFPRYVDRENLDVLTVETQIDEQEVLLPNITGENVAYFLFYRNEGQDYVANERCWSALDVFNLVPASCLAEFKTVLSALTKSLTNEREEKLSAIENIDEYSKAELVAVFRSTYHLVRTNTVYDEVFFNFLTAEEIANDDIKDSMRGALLSAAEGIVERQYSILPTIKDLSEKLRNVNYDDGRPREIAFKTVVLNRGFGDAVIFPAGKLIIAGETIPLVLDEPADLANPDRNADTLYPVVQKGNAYTAFFVVDRKANTVSGNQLVDKIISDPTPLEFKIEISSSAGPLIATGILSDREFSFELDLGGRP